MCVCVCARVRACVSVSFSKAGARTTASERVSRALAGALLVQATRARGRSRLVDDLQYVHAGDGAGIFGDLALVAFCSSSRAALSPVAFCSSSRAALGAFSWTSALACL